MKNYTVFFTPLAEQQLIELYAYVASNSGEARADNFVSGIVAFCSSLSNFPELGTRRDDVRPNLRTKSHGRRVTIAFSVNAITNIVAIHGIFYGGQDFERLLREIDDE